MATQQDDDAGVESTEAGGDWDTFTGKNTRYCRTNRPSVTISPTGSLRFNQPTRERFADDEDGPEYVRYHVDERTGRIGIEFTDGDRASDYSVTETSTASIQALLSSLDLEAPTETVMIELETSEDAPFPWFPLAPIVDVQPDEVDDGA